MKPQAQTVQMESGQRVRVAAGWYRTGRTPNAHVDVREGATGTVRVVHQATRLNPARVLVDLDGPTHPGFPGTAMIPPDRLEWVA